MCMGPLISAGVWIINYGSFHHHTRALRTDHDGTILSRNAFYKDISTQQNRNILLEFFGTTIIQIPSTRREYHTQAIKPKQLFIVSLSRRTNKEEVNSGCVMSYLPDLFSM